ncbi:MAG TPA: benenodin family lasso peptide [Sphingomonadaceae bacterium]|nr:benenodin family lasso peptide [Sphingomonadaceae bacterium]
MQREHEVQSELVDLGTATAETRGPVGIFTDDRLGQEAPGLSNN